MNALKPIGQIAISLALACLLTAAVLGGIYLLLL